MQALPGARIETEPNSYPPQPPQLPQPATTQRKIETLVIHGGEQVDFKAHGAIFPPIFTATSYVQRSLDDHGDYCYGRVQNPTRNAYETALRDLENGSYCAATGSGLAAASIILDLLEPGDHVLVHENVYGGSQRLFDTVDLYHFTCISRYISTRCYTSTSTPSLSRQSLTPTW
jgi:cystathionine beta-lyase/cystathionine gamma-synthase